MGSENSALLCLFQIYPIKQLYMISESWEAFVIVEFVPLWKFPEYENVNRSFQDRPN